MKDPIKGFKNALYPEGSITQYFGKNKELYFKAVCYPSFDGYKNFGEQYCLEGHNGVDIVAPWGTPICAVESGKIVDVKESEDGYGKHIRILCSIKDSNLMREWAYGHLSKIDIKLGDFVEEGTQIGLMGNTGFVVSGSTPYWKYNPYAGTHLHLGLRIVESYDANRFQKGIAVVYLNGNKAYVQNYNNGFYGAVDWIPLFIASQLEEIKIKVEKIAPKSIPTIMTIIGIFNNILKILGLK